MAQFETRTVTSLRHEYVLPSPAEWGELGKATAAAHQALRAAGKDPSADDAAFIEARDGEVVIYWIEERPES